MVVEPESLCWMTGRIVKARDGVTWAEEFARFPALRALVRDDGSGLGKGVKLERGRRRAANLPDLDDSLDVFHTLREGERALRKTWARPPAPSIAPTRLKSNSTNSAVRGNRARVMAHR